MNIAIKDIDSYISMQPEKAQASLEKIRQAIKSVAPEAEEMISYGMPAFKWNGMLVGFAAAKNHYGFYPWNSTSVALFEDELRSFETSKGAIRLPMDKPIPVALIKKIVRSRMKENLNKQR